MIKTRGLKTIALSALLLWGCDGDNSNDPMKHKKYIIINTSVTKGVCESQTFRNTLTAIGFKDFITRETDTSTTCQTYWKQDDGKECIINYVGIGNYNCVIGFNILDTGLYPKQTEASELYDVIELLHW